MDVDVTKKRQFSTDTQVKLHWAMLHAQKISSIADYCVERTTQQVADLIDVDRTTVMRSLRAYGIAYAIRGDAQCTPALGGQLSIRKVEDFHRQFAKKPSDTRVQEFIDEGFDKGDVAKILAVGWGVGETLVKKGLVKINDDYEEKLEIVRPWAIDVANCAAKVRSAAAFLDAAKMSDLKKGVTRDVIFAAHEQWMFQIERLNNLHGEYLEN